MPYAYNVYTGNGSATQYTIGFPYIRKEHVKVFVNYVDTTFTFANDTTAQLSSAPANGVRVEVRRVTPADNVLVDYTDGSTLTAADLDTNALQQLYLDQELDDAQKQVFAILPWVLMFVMAPFAVGLQIYWITTNCISIAQQKFLYSRHPQLQQAAAK